MTDDPWNAHRFGCAHLQLDCTWRYSHDFYTLGDFTLEEVNARNPLYLAVATGYKICKKCGANNVPMFA